MAAAVARIEEGVLGEATLVDLSRELGVTARHLRRAMQAELGVSPIELAQSRRLALAKQLLQDTSLSMAEIAFSSGFASIRRFNAAFRGRFERASGLRRAVVLPRGEGTATFPLPLAFRPPFEWPSLLGFLEARATPGVERVQGASYARTVRLGPHVGWFAVAPIAGKQALRADVSLSLSPRARAAGGARLRRGSSISTRIRRSSPLTLGPTTCCRSRCHAPPGASRSRGQLAGVEVGVQADPWPTGERGGGDDASREGSQRAFGERVATPHAELTTLFRPLAASPAHPKELASKSASRARVRRPSERLRARWSGRGPGV